MLDLLTILFAGIGIALLGVLAWWLLIASEGVYLGRRVVIWLYDLFANRYDQVKNYTREYEEHFLATPLMERARPQTDLLVLDVATGTGRLPLALLRNRTFEGRIIGVDLSGEMLRQAVRNLYVFEERVDWVQSPAEQLPFPDECFDVVTCLEALEFTTHPKATLVELIRVLRPGGLLLISQRINTRYMPGKTWTAGEMLALLEQYGIVQGQAQIWQTDYRKIWGRKAGQSSPVGSKPLDEIVRCPRCHARPLEHRSAGWLCPQCGAKYGIRADGVHQLVL
jgi:ubiquinone/menaquinone biosynthesis C-methylase UbiE